MSPVRAADLSIARPNVSVEHSRGNSSKHTGENVSIEPSIVGPSVSLQPSISAPNDANAAIASVSLQSHRAVSIEPSLSVDMAVPGPSSDTGITEGSRGQYRDVYFPTQLHILFSNLSKESISNLRFVCLSIFAFNFCF